MIAKLDARDEAIRGAIEKAKRDREEAERYLAEQKKALDDARRETAEMLQSAQQEAQRERQRIVEGARAEYDGIVQRGREQIENETKAALERVRKSIADMALQVAGRLLDRTVDASTHRQLAEDFVAELEKERSPRA
jgi:F-type H+-transporting ATPase subunit b